jgi:hypothetical protein
MILLQISNLYDKARFFGVYLALELSLEFIELGAGWSLLQKLAVTAMGAI